MTSIGLRPALLLFLLAPASMSSPQSRRGSSRTALPDQSSQADRPSRKSPQAACPHQKSRIDPLYPHPRILSCGLDSHKFSKGRYFSSCPYVFPYSRACELRIRRRTTQVQSASPRSQAMFRQFRQTRCIARLNAFALGRPEHPISCNGAILHRFRTAVRGHHGCFHVPCRLTVSEVWLALPNFNNITIRIANVAARLAVLVLWLRDKLGSSTSP